MSIRTANVHTNYIIKSWTKKYAAMIRILKYINKNTLMFTDVQVIISNSLMLLIQTAYKVGMKISTHKKKNMFFVDMEPIINEIQIENTKL
jgi:hypothetical protein